MGRSPMWLQYSIIQRFYRRVTDWELTTRRQPAPILQPHEAHTPRAAD